MAKIKGVFQMSGTIDGINYYMLDGKQIARKAGGGFNGKAIRLQANMEKVRQNASEFGAVSQAVKLFKHGLTPLLSPSKHPKLHGQLMKLFFGIKKTDVSATAGFRSVGGGLATAEGKKLLRGFSVPAYHSDYKILYQQVTFDRLGGVFDFECLRSIFNQLPKAVSGITVQVGVLDFSSPATALPMVQRNLVTFDRATLGSTPMTLLVEGVVPDKGIAVLSLCYLERRNGVLVPLETATSFYMEVVGVWG